MTVPMVSVEITLAGLRALDPEVIREAMLRIRSEVDDAIRSKAGAGRAPRMTGSLAGERPLPFRPTQRQLDIIDGKVDLRRFFKGRC